MIHKRVVQRVRPGKVLHLENGITIKSSCLTQTIHVELTKTHKQQELYQGKSFLYLESLFRHMKVVVSLSKNNSYAVISGSVQDWSDTALYIDGMFPETRDRYIVQEVIRAASVSKKLQKLIPNFKYDNELDSYVGDIHQFAETIRYIPNSALWKFSKKRRNYSVSVAFSHSDYLTRRIMDLQKSFTLKYECFQTDDYVLPVQLSAFENELDGCDFTSIEHRSPLLNKWVDMQVAHNEYCEELVQQGMGYLVDEFKSKSNMTISTIQGSYYEILSFIKSLVDSKDDELFFIGAEMKGVISDG